jgi:ABC transporter
LIEVHGLTKRGGARLAVDDVGFTVTEGEIFGILGVNGAGKTTTVECLQGSRGTDGCHMRVLGLEPRSVGSQLRAVVGSPLQAWAAPPGVDGVERLGGRIWVTDTDRLIAPVCAEVRGGDQLGPPDLRVHHPDLGDGLIALVSNTGAYRRTDAALDRPLEGGS